jgi:hypothetical protein
MRKGPDAPDFVERRHPAPVEMAPELIWSKWLMAILWKYPRTVGTVAVTLLVVAAVCAKFAIGNQSINNASASSSTSDGQSDPRSPTLADWASQPQGVLSRNLFCVHLDAFPADIAAQVPINGNGFNQKSFSMTADQAASDRTIPLKLRERASELMLEGTVLGDHPRAWIGGTLVGVGEIIDSTGFRVVKIESRKITVECQGVRIEISMAMNSQ